MKCSVHACYFQVTIYNLVSRVAWPRCLSVSFRSQCGLPSAPIPVSYISRWIELTADWQSNTTLQVLNDLQDRFLQNAPEFGVVLPQASETRHNAADVSRQSTVVHP